VSAPDPTAHTRPLPPTGPPFLARTPTSPAPQPATAEDDSDEEASDEDDEDASDEDGSDEDGSDKDEE